MGLLDTTTGDLFPGGKIATDFDIDCGLGVTCAKGLPDAFRRSFPLGGGEGVAGSRMMGLSDGLADGPKPIGRVATTFGRTGARCTGDGLIDGCVVANVETELVENCDGEKERNCGKLDGEFEIFAAEKSIDWLEGATMLNDG